MRHQKSQSAMEYLMTYSWAIVILLAIIAALYTLGVFSGGARAGAPPGSCQVVRPNGPGTTQQITLDGECTGVPPEYVAQFNGNTYINVSYASRLSPTQITECVWVKPSSTGTSTRILGAGLAGGNSYYDMYDNSGIFGMRASNAISSDYGQTSGGALSTTYSFLCSTYSSGTMTLYINGTSQTLAHTPALTGNLGTYTGNFMIGGAASNGNTRWVGVIANVQLYSTVLSANEVSKLYLEGIGGPPILLTSLIGWWPLNGNTNDYSGNNDNGQLIAAGLSYNNTWTKVYTTP